MDWLPVVSAGTDPMFTYMNGYLFVCLFIYYGNLFYNEVIYFCTLLFLSA